MLRRHQMSNTLYFEKKRGNVILQLYTKKLDRFPYNNNCFIDCEAVKLFGTVIKKLN